MFVTFENSKIIGGYRSLNMGVLKYKINRWSQLLSRPDRCEVSLTRALLGLWIFHDLLGGGGV